MKPFLNRAFGSELRLMRQVIINSGKKKISLDKSEEEVELKLMAEALKEEIIFK